MSVSLSEAEVHWRDFLASLQARGLHGVKLVVSDAHAGLKPALDARLTGVPWQRCQFHLMKNALAFVPEARDAGRGGGRPAGGLRRPGPARGRASVGPGGEEVPHDVPRSWPSWLEANVAEGLAVFALPRSHRRRLRTSNMLERLNEEMKRRTRVAGLFPNDASLLRLVSAVLMEVSEDWETNRKYLTMGPA